MDAHRTTQHHRRRPHEDVASLSYPPEGGSPPQDSSALADGSAPTHTHTGHQIIGQVVGPRGVHGELKVAIALQDPQSFRLLQQVFLGDHYLRFQVVRARLHEGQALLHLSGIDDRNAAETWRGAYVYGTREEALPLEEDEYYCDQLQGLTVVTVEGEVLGRVTDILATGANDVYVVQGQAGEILLPAIKDVIVRISLDEGLMVVRLLEGLR